MPTESPIVKFPAAPLLRMTDCHFHVFPPGAAAVSKARYVPAYGATLERWRAGSRVHQIHRGVVVQPSFLGTDNTALLQALSEDPEALRGVVVVAPDADVASLQAMHRVGVRGIRVNLVGTDHDVCRHAGGPLFDALGAQGWHVEIHVDPGRLSSVLDQLPAQLTVVVDHFGKPAREEEIDSAARGRVDRLYVKLSAPYRLAGSTPEKLAARWLAQLGPERLLWGSDWPCTAHEQHQAGSQDPRVISAWLRSDALADKILCGNPQRLYQFG